MRFSGFGLIKGIVISLVICLAIYGGMRAFGYVDVDDPAALSRQAYEALDAVRKRQPSDRRPASYDDILRTLDQMLHIARGIVEGENFNPNTDYEKLRSYAVPVIEIAGLADAQARTETGFLTKEYRFNDQRGEAIQYLASAMWERINARRPIARSPLDTAPPLPAGEMNELRRLLDSGLEVAPQNRELWYIRGVINRAEGLFAPAARDLERAVEIDSNYATAWNTLGLVRISLREFDEAERALERAKVLALDEAARMNTLSGAEYVSIIYNLAMFHEGLASFYIRENRVSPTGETQRFMTRHVIEARKYLQEFISLEPSGSPDAAAALIKLNALPR